MVFDMYKETQAHQPDFLIVIIFYLFSKLDLSLPDHFPFVVCLEDGYYSLLVLNLASDILQRQGHCPSELIFFFLQKVKKVEFI